jgi:hypothetical protein
MRTSTCRLARSSGTRCAATEVWSESFPLEISLLRGDAMR